MFRSTTIIRELVLNMAKVTFILRHPIKLRCYMLFGDVAACQEHNATESHSAQHTTHTPLYDMLPHHQITYSDVILPSVLI
jgi:hypothetical protein